MARINLTGPKGPPVVRKDMSAPAFTPSPQQAAIFLETQLGRGNFIVEAVAGAGKTTTLVEVCKLIAGNAAFLAFNKKIATDIGAKLRAAGIDEGRVRAATFHAMGFAAWRRIAPRVRLKEEKSEQLMEQLGVPRHLRAFVKQLASLAKQAVYGEAFRPEGRDDWLDMIDYYDVVEKLTAGVTSLDQQAAEGIDWTLRLLMHSITTAQEVVDFDDMIWIPLHQKATFWQYDWLLVDEAQDTNAARRLMCQRMLRPSGRLIAVGDRHQAIYGFTGADANSLDLIADTFGAKYMPLTTTYRCPKAVVRHAHQWVSHIQAAPEAPEGSVETISMVKFTQAGAGPCIANLRAEDAILCRNTKPLVSLAFDLIRRKIPCHVEGREIGKGLLALARHWRSVTTIGQLEDKLAEYLREETERLQKTGKLAKIGAVEDKVDTLLVLCESLLPNDPIYKLEAVVNDLFQDSDGKQRPSVTLSTVHKAKGREWDRVFLLGRDEFMPSKYATQPWQKEQEANLCYVAVTRAKRELIEVRTLPAEPESDHDYLIRRETEDAEALETAAVQIGAVREPTVDLSDEWAAMREDNIRIDPERLREFVESVPDLDNNAVVQLPWKEGDFYEEVLEAKREPGPDEFAALYENRVTVPTFHYLNYYCPNKGRDFNVGGEDIRFETNSIGIFAVVRKCFCGETHRFPLRD